ncbi:MAG: isoprenoid biosynthesis protein with amidotransferase-like protein [uncultured bacterium]|nr:MAG: isoprenoid biosynthesis protein with amidotransferase-like protein [uncultured bacterium]OGT54367.1 MAG: isoprenoid biosynthesis protein ElbB [Gammaproteobacteria bacterium RIFCSPHIGHO2_12_FULL_42_10]
MKKFALVLSGCGQHDGSETHEVILTLLSMAQEGVSWEAFAPDIIQDKVINHLTDQVEASEKRSVLKESARLVRGKIQSLSMANAADFDAIVFPGGLGAVSVLCNWKDQGLKFNIITEVKRFIDDAVKLKKPMGFICIAPIMIPSIYSNASLTIGNDATLANQIKEMGSNHINCPATEVVVDKTNKLVSTPANMVAKNIDEVYIGIKKLIKELVVMS